MLFRSLLRLAGVQDNGQTVLFDGRTGDAFHEDVTNQILNDVIAAVHPRWAKIVGDWNVRGGIRTIVTAEHNKS